MFITTVRFLWGFNLERARDENGELIPVDFTTEGMVPGSFSSPKPFPCGIFSLCFRWVDGSYYAEERET